MKTINLLLCKVGIHLWDTFLGKTGCGMRRCLSCGRKQTSWYNGRGKNEWLEVRDE